MSPPTNKHRRIYSLKSLLELVMLLALTGLLIFGFIKHQAISDWVRLRGYKPPASVDALVNQDTMTSYTQHLFYLNRPQLINTVSGFRKYCPENNNDDVLGCYHAGENGIFIYNVQDPTLQGVAQVTAAHEVLHAIYERLSTNDRKQLDTELTDYYEHDLTDPMVKAEITIYKQTEPTSVYDEMSCTFGTEVANLPSSLSIYYNHYFKNRLAIVAYEQQYESQYSMREATISKDNQNLNSLQQTINSEQTMLDTQMSTITLQQTKLNDLKNSGQISTYNAGVPDYNEMVNSYNALVQVLDANVTTFNRLLVARNAITGQLTTLDKALDTRLPAQSMK